MVMNLEPLKPKKFINLIIPYQKQDQKIQREQNDLILKNTRITIIIGIVAIGAQLLEVLVSLIK